MSDESADTQRRIEDERRRLAVIIESLDDGLIVTEPGAPTIATVNPRATELVPELTAGGRVIAYTGDPGPSPDIPDLARDADLFIAEATSPE